MDERAATHDLSRTQSVTSIAARLPGAVAPGSEIQSDSSHQDEDQQYDNDQAEATRRPITPIAAISPARQRADQKQDQEDEKNRSKHAALPYSCRRENHLTAHLFRPRFRLKLVGRYACNMRETPG